MNKNLFENFRNGEIRIFISSTFKDMMKEREYLVKKVFPALRKKFKDHAVTITEVDLRWGVLEEEAQNGKVIDICLTEVDKTRPYFIGLIGERYGWIPDKSEYEKHKKIIENFGWIKEDIANGLSITEMEIQYGVLRNQKMWDRSFFYLRDPENQNSQKYKENESSEEFHKLSLLKKVLHKNSEIKSSEFSNNIELGNLVFDDLSKIIEEDFPQLDDHNTKLLPQLNLVSNLTKIYHPNEILISEIETFLKDSETPIAITGNFGIGKSALLAYLTLRFHKNKNVLFNFCSTNSEAIDPSKFFYRFLMEIDNDIKLELSGTRQNKLEIIIEQTLKYIEESNTQFLFIIDDFELIKSELSIDIFNYLIYLASFKNVSVIVSFGEEKLRERFEWAKCKIIDLQVMPAKKKEILLQEYLGFYSKKLPQLTVNRLVNLEITDYPLVMKSFLNELIRYGEYETLNTQVEKYAAKSNIDEFYGQLLNELESEFHNSKLGFEKILSACAITIYGILEIDLFQISGLSRMDFNYIINIIEPELSYINGRFKLENKYLLKVVQRKFLITQKEINLITKIIIDVIADRGKGKGDLDTDDTNDIAHLLAISNHTDILLDYAAELNMIWWLYHEDQNLLIKFWFKIIDIKNPEDIYTPNTIIDFLKKINGTENNRFQIFIGLSNFAHIFELLECFNGAKKIYEYIIFYLTEPIETEINQNYIKIFEEFSLINSYIKLGEFDLAEERLDFIIDSDKEIITDNKIAFIRYFTLCADLNIKKKDFDSAADDLRAIDQCFEEYPNLVNDGAVDENVLLAIQSKIKYFDLLENYEIALELCEFVENKIYFWQGDKNIQYIENLISKGKFQTLNGEPEAALGSFAEAEVTAKELFGDKNNCFVNKIYKVTKELGI